MASTRMQHCAVVRDWEVVFVITSSPDEEAAPIGGAERSSLFFAIQDILPNGRAVWIVVKRMQALVNAGEVTYRP